MNLQHVNTREIVIIGNGKIPKNEIAQIVKELSALAGTTTYSVLPLTNVLPKSVMTEIVNNADPDDSAFILYQQSWPDHGEWNSYQWDHSYLRDHEDDDFVVMWLLSDDPVPVEVDFAHNVLDADVTLLIMNEGLWQVDRMAEDGMYERMAPEPVPDNTAVTIPSVVQSIDEVNPVPQIPLHPAQQAHVDELARVEPNIEHLTALPTNGDPEAVHPSQEKPPVLTVAEQIADPVAVPEPTPYDRMGRAELKALVEERGVKADKRSVDIMIAALVADDKNGESSPTLEEVFVAVAEAEFGTTDEDDVPMVPDEGDPEVLERHRANMASVQTNLDKVTAGAKKIQRMAEEAKPKDQTRERLGIMMGILETMAEHHRELALLTAQLADVMLAVMQSDD